jgi:hypothetical protein
MATIVTRFPTANEATADPPWANDPWGDPPWTSPNNLHADDAAIATADLSWVGTATDDASNRYKTFGFDGLLPSNAVIDAVKVISQGSWGVDFGNGTLDLRLMATIGGVDQTLHVQTVDFNENTYTTDLTSDRAWTRADLLDANFKLFVDGHVQGITSGNGFLNFDFVSVEVTWSEPVIPPTFNPDVFLFQTEASLYDIKLRDPLSAGGPTPVTGVAAVTQPAGLIVAAGVETFVGAAAMSQPPGTISAAGAEIFVGSGAMTQPASTITASGNEIFVGTVAMTQPASTITASGAEVFVGAAAMNQAAGAIAAAGIEIFVGNPGIVTQPAGAIAATGLVVNAGRVGAAAITQPVTTITGSGAVTAPPLLIGGVGGLVTVWQMVELRIVGRARIVQKRGRLSARGQVTPKVVGASSSAQTAPSVRARGRVIAHIRGDVRIDQVITTSAVGVVRCRVRGSGAIAQGAPSSSAHGEAAWFEVDEAQILGLTEV